MFSFLQIGFSTNNHTKEEIDTETYFLFLQLGFLTKCSEKIVNSFFYRGLIKSNPQIPDNSSFCKSFLEPPVMPIEAFNCGLRSPTPVSNVDTSDFRTVPGAFLFTLTLHSINDKMFFFPQTIPPTSTSFQFLIRRFEDLLKSSSSESSMVVIIELFMTSYSLFRFFMLFRIPLFANFLFLFTQVISQVIRWTVLH